MQTIRANLTRLKSLAEKKLPDDQDIFGYPGVSKELILYSLDEAYQLSYSLAEVEPRFEITILKRKVSHLIEACKEFLSEGVTSWSKEKKFDEFVSNLTKVKEEIRLTYLIVVDKGLRTEAAANKVIEDYESLVEAYKKYESELGQIAEKHQRVTEAYDTAQHVTETLGQYLAKSKALSDSITSLQSESESAFDLTTKYETEIREKREFIADLSSKLGSLENKARTTSTKAESQRKDFEALKRSLQEQAEVNRKQQQEIQDTLDNANRMGMAGSFKSRKDELDFPIKIWGGVFIFAILSIFLVAWHFVAPYLTSQTEVKYIDIFIRIALVTPFVWLAWMSVKQYGYISRIREDYAYKYASAMAFEGYRKHAKEIDAGLLRQLLSVSVENLSQNPIRLFNAKDNHASPINEIFKDAVGAITEKRLSVDSAGKDATDKARSS